MSRKALTLLPKGFCIGAADVVPGVSGGTMAFILGVYPQLINAIKSFDLIWLQSVLRFDVKQIVSRPHFSFLIPVLVGAFIALIFFTRIVPLPLLIRTYPEIIYGLFFGLILGSILFLNKQTGFVVLLKNLPLVLGGVLFGGLVVTLVPASTPDADWFIFICGMVAISAMLLPGISGSFILLMMKKYAYIFNALGQFELTIILPFIAGILTGVVLFSRVFFYMLKRFYQQTMLFIIGLLCSSLYIIWPFQQRQFEIIRDKERLISSTPYIPDMVNSQVIYSLLMILLGLALVFILELFAESRAVNAD